MTGLKRPTIEKQQPIPLDPRGANMRISGVHPFVQNLSIAGVLCLGLLIVAGALLISCQSPNTTAARVNTYQQALSSVPNGSLAEGSAEERAAIQRVKDYLSDLTPENVTANTKNVYAADAFFNDTLKTIQGVEGIQHYFEETAQTVTSISVTFDDVARSGNDYYFRWRMEFAAPKLSKGEPIHTIGMTQIRFNSEGKVVLHQDFWDSATGLFEHLPVTNQMIHAVRKRL